jgi:hypothetical protein
MAQDYRMLTESIKDRINPEHLAVQRDFSVELSSIAYSDVLVYVRLAMKGVEPEYTNRSKLAGERVKEHLIRNISNVNFRYQGSVMTNTHIRAHSDIDLLTLSDKFYRYDSYSTRQVLNEQYTQNRFNWQQLQKLNEEVNTGSYSGSSIDDLRQLRLDCEKTLSSKYSVCDITHAKAIKITNLDLKRDVDVVIANFYDDVTSIVNSKGEYRGIEVYNKDAHRRETVDYPFLSIKRINDRGDETVGRIKKMIRFLKNIKAKSTSAIGLTSFDFNAICYDIDVNQYKSLKFYQLVPVLHKQLKSLSENKYLSDALMSVDGREPIFLNKPEKLQSLKYLLSELDKVYNDMIQSRIL